MYKNLVKSTLKHIWHNNTSIPYVEDGLTIFSKGGGMCIDLLKKHGAILLDNISPNKQSVKQIADPLGPIRYTKYDYIWDTNGTKSNKTNDSVYSKASLPPHTDLTYLDYPPRWQLFLCKKQDTRRNMGDTLLVDGLSIAQDIEENYPDYYDRLTKEKFISICSEEKLVSTKQIIKYSDDKRYPRIYFNSIDMVIPNNRYDDYYYPYNIFKILTLDEHYKKQFKLKKNQALIIDNHRILHGRTSFLKERNFLGCYIDEIF